MQRYDRQIRLEGFGMDKQQQLLQGSVLVIGAGGLGVPVLQYLSAMGIGRLGIVEHDEISITNLHRQVLYTTADQGKSKIHTAATKLQQLNPDIQLELYDTYLDTDNALDILASYDVIVDCTDNFGSRYLINDACVILNKPLVYGAIQQFDGQVSVFNYQGSATYRCLFPEPPGAGEAPNCNELGVLGILPGIIGCYMANEVVKVISQIGTPLAGQLLSINILDNQHQTFRFSPVPGNHNITALQNDYAQSVCNTGILKSIAVEQLQQWLNDNTSVQLIDVREDHEWEICHIPQAIHVPMRQVAAVMHQWQPQQRIAVLCHHGMRSHMIGQQLVAAGFRDVYNVEGGIHAWSVKVDNKMMQY